MPRKRKPWAKIRSPTKYLNLSSPETYFYIRADSTVYFLTISCGHMPWGGWLKGVKGPSETISVPPLHIWKLSTHHHLQNMLGRFCVGVCTRELCVCVCGTSFLASDQRRRRAASVVQKCSLSVRERGGGRVRARVHRPLLQFQTAGETADSERSTCQILPGLRNSRKKDGNK